MTSESCVKCKQSVTYNYFYFDCLSVFEIEEMQKVSVLMPNRKRDGKGEEDMRYSTFSYAFWRMVLNNSTSRSSPSEHAWSKRFNASSKFSSSNRIWNKLSSVLSMIP